MGSRSSRAVTCVKLAAMRVVTIARGFVIVVVLVIASASWVVQAQEGGVAEITAPLPGVPQAGQVTISGTATHPAFTRYTIEFAYDPNVTDTWFPLPAPGNAAVVNGPLAVWDTTGITPGTYMLRLRVFSDQPILTETILTGLVVGLPATATPTANVEAPGEPPTVTPTATSPVVLPPTSTPAVTRTPTLSVPVVDAPGEASPLAGSLLALFLDSFYRGVVLAVGAFVVLGVYQLAARRLRGPLRKWLRRILSDLRRP